ncbi:MAG TPA: hypothetical protein VGU25_06170 [Acidobacteriaceae bacterium]|nr:hypothetical protein [Acidobacteriaceae bacterium]
MSSRGDRDFLAVVFNESTGRLYWYDNLRTPGTQLVLMPASAAFLPAAYTKEKLLIVVCNSHLKTSASLNPLSIAVPEASVEVAAGAAIPAVAGPPGAAHVEAPAASLPAPKGPGFVGQSPEEIKRWANKVASDTLAYYETYSAIEARLAPLERKDRDLPPLLSAISADTTTILSHNSGAPNDDSALDAKLFDDAVANATQLQDPAIKLSKAYSEAGIDSLQSDANSLYIRLAEDAESPWYTTEVVQAADAQVRERQPAFPGIYNLKPPSSLENREKKITNDIAQATKVVPYLNAVYTNSPRFIVLPVPAVTSNSLQYFTLTVTDNLTPIIAKKPDDTSGKKTGSPCPKNCCCCCPATQAPSPTAAASPGSQKTASTITGNPVQVTTKIDEKQNITYTATFIVPFHRIVHFAAVGGFLAARATANAYSIESTPETVVTTTTTTSIAPGATSTTGSTATTTSTTGPTTTTTTSTTTGSTVTTITQTIVPTYSTATFAFQSERQPVQTFGILGVNWYPLGRDSFSRNRRSLIFGERRPATDVYDRHSFAQNLAPGLLVGTAVNTAGVFVIAPEWDIAPGVSLFGGLTLTNRTSLAQNISLCPSLGTSSSTTTPYGPVTTSSNGASVTTQVQVVTTTGCSSSTATMLSGTTVPTTSALIPSFGFGIAFNSNLFSYFGGKN